MLYSLALHCPRGSSEVDLLRGELEHEQEKREEMEREMDHLRRRLHLANKDLAQLQVALGRARQVILLVVHEPATPTLRLFLSACRKLLQATPTHRRGYHLREETVTRERSQEEPTSDWTIDDCM